MVGEKNMKFTDRHVKCVDKYSNNRNFATRKKGIREIFQNHKHCIKFCGENAVDEEDEGRRRETFKYCSLSQRNHMVSAVFLSRKKLKTVE